MDDDKHRQTNLVFDVDPGFPWFQDLVGGNMMEKPRQSILMPRFGGEDTEPGRRKKREESVKRNLLRMAKRSSLVPKEAKRAGLVRMSKKAGLVRMSKKVGLIQMSKRGGLVRMSKKAGLVCMSKRPSYTSITSMPNVYCVPKSRPFLDRIKTRSGIVRISKKNHGIHHGATEQSN